MIVELVFIFNAKGSKVWVKTISFTRKYIEIRKMFYRVLFPLEPTQVLPVYVLTYFAQYIKRSVLAIGRERYLGSQRPEPKYVKNLYKLSKCASKRQRCLMFDVYNSKNNSKKKKTCYNYLLRQH